LLPLNKFDSYIEYSTYTQPILNSAITVRTWLYYGSPISRIFWNFKIC
jgi:hypothetical protein